MTLVRAFSGFVRRHDLALTVLVAIIAGVLLSLLIPKPRLGVIELRGQIDRSDVNALAEALDRAEDDAAIRGVLLLLDSPGGQAADIEELYLRLLAFRSKKPIVAAVDRMAASGAYYLAIAANSIVAKPSSDIGGIGVISVLPRPPLLDEETIVTGPFKESGGGAKASVARVQQIGESFLNAVLTQRGARLRLTREELALAELYTGIEALRFGLIDSVGSVDDALEKLARLARVGRWQTVQLRQQPVVSIFIVLSVDESELNATNTVPIDYYLYLPVAAEGAREVLR